MARVIRFAVVGSVSTVVAYAFVMGLLSLGFHYSVAVAGSWPPAMLTGFAFNRRFTFGIVGQRKRVRHFGLFIVGSLLQLGIAIAGFGVLTQHYHFGPTLAFICNFAVTTTFSYAFMAAVTFRERG